MNIDFPENAVTSSKDRRLDPDIKSSGFPQEVTPSEKNNFPDPDLELLKKKHDFESSDEHHKIRMFVLKWGSRILFFGGIAIMLFIFFVIMPFSEMDLSAESRIEWIQNYSAAFLYALGSFGVTVLAVIVSELLKLLYKFMRTNRKVE